MWNIATSVVRELIRDRILSIIVLFGALLILFSLALSTLSVGAHERLVVDFSLAMIEMVSLIVVVFVGSQVLFREIEGRTIYLLLSKPISRRDFIFGKILGFAIILGIIVAVEGIISAGLIGYTSPELLTWTIPVAIAMTYMKLLILFAIILFFSTFVSPMIAILVSVGIYIAGHSMHEIMDLMITSHHTDFLPIGRFLSTILPDFEALNVKNLIHTPDLISASYSVFGYFSLPYLLTTILYALLYFSIILAFSVLIFERRSFER